MSKVRIYGDTSGYIDVAAPATADNSTLDLSTVAKTTGDITFTQESASSPYPEQKIKWSNDSTTANGFYVSQDADRNGRIWHEQGLDIKFGTTNTERMKIDYDGRVTMPNQPMVQATRNGGTFTASSGVFVFNSVNTNIGSHYNNSTGVFTAPVTGLYYLSFFYLAQSGDDHDIHIRKNGAQFPGADIRCNNNAVNSNLTHGASVLMNLSANDTADVFVSSNAGGTIYGSGLSGLTIMLMG